MITSEQLLSVWTSCFSHRYNIYTTIHAQSCQADTERQRITVSCVFHTYFVVIECVDWNKFVWIKVLFLENHNISYLLYLSRAEMHFGDTWNKCTTLCYLLSLHHFHHVWCVCKSQEEFTNSNVSCRVISRPKHFLVSLQIVLLKASSFVKYIYTLTGHFIRYTLPVPGWTPFCLQNCLNSSWHRFNKVLETLLRDFGPYWYDSITQFL